MADERISSTATGLDQIPGKIGGLVGAVGGGVAALTAAIFLPFSLLGRLIGPLSGICLGVQAKKMAERKIKDLSTDMAQRIESIDNREIGVTVDSIFGPLLIIIEVLGGLLGAVAGGSVYYLFAR